MTRRMESEGRLLWMHCKARFAGEGVLLDGAAFCEELRRRLDESDRPAIKSVEMTGRL